MSDPVSEPREASYEALFDPEAVDQRGFEQKQAERLALDRQMVLCRLLADQETRAFLWEILDAAHAFETRFGGHGGVPDLAATFLFAGEQKVGWWLWAILDEAAPDLASQMRRDAKGLDAVLRERLA